ncbi:MAG: hypothetical protein QOF49_256, partial [Chloroflexota bacterium]|nr:hypothetical protein [Chloroflexota bacterium]
MHRSDHRWGTRARVAQAALIAIAALLIAAG